MTNITQRISSNRALLAVGLLSFTATMGYHYLSAEYNENATEPESPDPLLILSADPLVEPANPLIDGTEQNIDTEIRLCSEDLKNTELRHFLDAAIPTVASFDISADEITRLHEMVSCIEYDQEDLDTGLSQAVNFESPLIVQFLIDLGANADNRSLLKNAARLDNAEIVKLLIDNGADPHDRILATAIHKDSMEVAELLLDYNVIPTQHDLHTSLNKEDMSMARLLIDHSVDLYENVHLLQNIVRSGSRASIALLIEYGLDPHAHNALEWAAHDGKADMAQLIMEYGSPPERIFEHPSLLRAARTYPEIVTLYQSYGVDILQPSPSPSP